MKRILFLCSKNRLRSLTAEAVFSEIDTWEVASAGISHDADVRVSAEDIDWADIIFVMESVHRNKLNKKFGALMKNTKVISLNIPDDFEYMDPQLIEILQQKVPKLVD
ncbi:protein tyrosine phosphatase [Enterovibrio norvegicus]|nr:protein tyrosine phosphatase [Enterovibrio norvegicus]PMI31810.1 protein tyrosine phosphatase [Enterovibrio norvegicus]TKF17564.1 protein tyrosine phosphatase [Enterovibrio norvegicus]TKF35715.1 protein tyrosine phosphatase [Enterovibrio norvegicus]